MGIHESQSRFYENLLGRSEAYVNYVFPKVCECFPEQMKGYTANDLYKAINLVTPSLIRTESDELTYCLHIMVRYEIEKMLIDEKETASDSDEETPGEDNEGEEDSQEVPEDDSSESEPESDGDESPNFEELYKKAMKDLAEAQKKNREVARQIEKQKETVSTRLDKAFEEIFE